MNYEEIINNIRCRCGHCSFVIRRANDRNESILDANVECLADGEYFQGSYWVAITTVYNTCGVGSVRSCLWSYADEGYMCSPGPCSILSCYGTGTYML